MHNMSLCRFGFWLRYKNFYIRMRGDSNVAALVFIGAPVYIICRYVAFVMLVCSADECV